MKEPSNRSEMSKYTAALEWLSAELLKIALCLLSTAWPHAWSQSGRCDVSAAHIRARIITVWLCLGAWPYYHGSVHNPLLWASRGNTDERGIAWHAMELCFWNNEVQESVKNNNSHGVCGAKNERKCNLDEDNNRLYSSLNHYSDVRHLLSLVYHRKCNEAEH